MGKSMTTDVEIFRVLTALERINAPVQQAILELIARLDEASEQMIVAEDSQTRASGTALRKVLFSLNRDSWRKT